MKKNKIFTTMFAVCLCIYGSMFFASCTQSEFKEPQDGPTYGELHITADETLRPIIDSQITSFMATYDRTKITVSYKPEAEVINDLVNDSSRLVITTRKLNETENRYFDSIKYFPKYTTIAFDAIAVLVHPSNKDSVFRMRELFEMAQGKIVNWKEYNRLNPLGKITMVFDNKNSSIVRYFLDSIGSTFNKQNTFAVSGSEQVVDYISKNPEAIGFVGVNWVSEKSDSQALSFLSKIRVAELYAPDTSSVRGEYFKPFQAYIALKYYPMSRAVYMINREPYTGLAHGFSAYVAGEKGQRIILRAGLVPSSMPIRLVEVKNQKFTITP